MNTKKIEELENTIKQAQKQIEELKKEDEMSKFKYPKYYDSVWSINPLGEICKFRWRNSPSDKEVFHQGGIFLTEEETEFEVERRKVIGELKLFAEPEDREWDNCNEHYILLYDVDTDILHISARHRLKTPTIYFETQEIAQKAIDTVGEDRIKKYYLEVE